jgi:hypothetical protein
MTSIAMLNARAKATASQIDFSWKKAFNIMNRLNRATITVRAFFSIKYFLIIVRFSWSQREREFTQSAARSEPLFDRNGENVGGREASRC